MRPTAYKPSSEEDTEIRFFPFMPDPTWYHEYWYVHEPGWIQTATLQALRLSWKPTRWGLPSLRISRPARQETDTPPPSAALR
jgi:hypothetical protein